MTAAKIATCLWFDRDGEDAATFYCSLIPGSRDRKSTRLNSSHRL